MKEYLFFPYWVTKAMQLGALVIENSEWKWPVVQTGEENKLEKHQYI